MTPTAFDLETVCFGPGFMAPPPVCASTYHPQDGLRIWTTDELPYILERLLDDPTPVVTHGGAYDAACILEWLPQLKRKLWSKFEKDEWHDSLITQRIIEIETGDNRGSLALDNVGRCYGIEFTKSPVRTDFGRYYGRPLSEYSAEHLRYVGADSADMWEMYQRQRSRGLAATRDICDLARGDFWLRLVSNWGVRTDPNRVDQLEEMTTKDLTILTELAQEWGAMRTKPPMDPSKWFSRDTKVIRQRVLEAYEGNPPRTDSYEEAMRDPELLAAKLAKDPLFGISASKVSLADSGDEDLEKLQLLGELLAVRNKDVTMLRAGVVEPIHTRFGFAATTRTTSRSPNLQNFRRKAGIRECLIPRPGNCFVETDYPSLELFAVAQVCAWKLGRHDLVNQLNRGRDYHCVLGARILGMNPESAGVYEEFVANKKREPYSGARQVAKNGNYGLLGWMTNPETFARYIRNGSRTADNPQGIPVTPAEALTAMNLWREHAGDPVFFLDYVNTLRNPSGYYDVEIPGTTITRRGCTRCAGANTHFQGLGAVVTREAGWQIAKAQYIDGTMPARTVLFTHDSFAAECAVADRTTVANQLEEIMAAALTKVCPDMFILPMLQDPDRKNVTRIKSSAMTNYTKNAPEGEYDDAGELLLFAA